MASYPYNTLFNLSAFDGRVVSDFLRVAAIGEDSKADLINYSVADFDEFKQAFLDYAKAVYKDQYNNFFESDLGIMFAELFAYFAAVNSMKADFIANEGYLHTARRLGSVQKRLQYLGIDMKGPIAAMATGRVYGVGNITFSAGDTLTIPYTSRIITTKSERDGKPLSFLLCKTNLSTGKIDQISTNNIEALLVDDDYLSSDVTYFEGFVLLEGLQKTKTGVFSNNLTNQTVKVQDASIIEASIYVSGSDGRIYNEITNLALASGIENVFEKKYEDDYSVTLYFGDGVRGYAPSPGSTYKVFYRTGGGERGNLISNKIAIVVPATLSNANGTSAINISVRNSTTTTGGSNSETIEHAKKYAPYYFASQYRYVNDKDILAAANMFVSTAGQSGKATAAVRQNGAGGNMIDVYVVRKATDRQVERASLAFKGELLEYINANKMLNTHYTIVDGLVRTLDLVCTVVIDKGRASDIENIKTQAAEQLLSYFSVDNLEFGQGLSFNDLANYMLRLPSIRYFKIDNLDGDIFLNFNELIQLNNFEINIEYI
jgi:hypothetical protein